MTEAATKSPTARFMALLPGYERAHVRHTPTTMPDKNGKLKGSYFTDTTRGATPEDYQAHLDDHRGLGVIPLMKDNTCRFGAIDIDNAALSKHHKTVELLEKHIRQLEIPFVVCRSKSGAAHLYLFSKEPLPAKELVAKLKAIVKMLGYPDNTEIIPKQVERKDDDPGTCINLPYRGVLDGGTDRYCIRDGKHITSLEEFVAYGERMAKWGTKWFKTAPKKIADTPKKSDDDERFQENNRDNDIRDQIWEWVHEYPNDEEMVTEWAVALGERKDPDRERGEKHWRDLVRRSYEKASKQESNAQPADDDALIVNRDDISEQITKADRLFSKMSDERLFQDRGRIVRIVRAGKLPPTEGIVTCDYQAGEPQPSPDGNIVRDSQASTLVQVNWGYLRDVLSSTGKVQKETDKGLARVLVPKDAITKGLIDRVKNAPEKVTLRELVMLTNAPKLLESDLRIICKSGYDEKSGIFIDAPEGKFVDRKPEEKLSPEEWRGLLEKYFDPCFEGFLPYLPRKEYFSVILAGAMAVALRNLIRIVPFTLLSAPSQGQGSGKSLIPETISLLTIGRLPGVCGYRSEIEFSKHLYIMIEDGDQIISVDNVKVGLIVDNSDLSMLGSTPGAVTFRPLGIHQQRPVVSKSTIFINGNDLQVATDLDRRCLLIQIEAGENPSRRKFPFHPHDRARQLHPQAAMLLLRIARAYVRAGSPMKGQLREMGGFYEFTKWVREPLAWLEFPDLLVTQDELFEKDPARRDGFTILRILASHFKGPFQLHEVTAALKEHPGELDAIMTITGHKDNEHQLDPRKVARYFRDNLLNQPFGGLTLRHVGQKNNSAVWRIERTQEVPGAEKEAL